MWWQAVVCLVLWVGFGAWVVRSGWARERRPRGRFAGPGLMVAAGIFLLSSLTVVVQRGGIEGGLLTGWGFVVTVLAGAVFVGAQTVGAVWAMEGLLRGGKG